MPRKGENIRKRTDGRWEARYLFINETGKKLYKSVYADTYLEVKKKRLKVLQEKTTLQVKYEIGGFSVVDTVSLLIESLYVESFDCNSDLKGGEFKSANHRISVFHLCILAFFLFHLYYITQP